MKAPKQFPGTRVLVIDDDPDILETYAALLETSMGMKALQAASGPEALSMLAKNRVGLIVVDFRMPGMNGLEFLKEAGRIQKDIPAIVITAYPELDIAIEALNEARIKYYLTKPVSAERLQAAVAGALGFD